MDKLNQNLGFLIKKAGFSENELARRTGIPQQVISRIARGLNKNPKITTLIVLASYFGVSTSQLLGETPLKQEELMSDKKDVPFIEWNAFSHTPLEQLALNSKRTICIDMPLSHKAFAVTLGDDSMEPKFSKGTLLIIDPDKKPHEGSFVLLYSSTNKTLVLRQVFIKEGHIHTQCLNPQSEDHQLKQINQKDKYVGLLVQSRMDFEAPST